jgi:HSP20 family protein
MSILRFYDPLDRLFHKRLIDLIDDFERPVAHATDHSGDEPKQGKSLVNRPKINFIESDASWKVEVELPGVNMEDIQVQIQKDILSISAERKEEKKIAAKEGEKGEGVETSQVKFKRVLRLPGAIDAKNITSTFRNGLLTINLPKKEDEKPIRVNIAKL